MHLRSILPRLMFLSMLLQQGGCSEAETRPNFLFILCDDLGYRDLGSYGSTFHDTPHLDRLAASGMLFSQGYAAHPVCSPTRAAIMTGKNPARVGITDWIPGRDPRDRRLLGPTDLHQLPLEETTIVERFRQAGYRTFFAGKWHLGGEDFLPEDQGFEHNKGGHHRGSPPGGYYSPYQNPRLADGPEGEYLPDRLTDETLSFIDANQGQLFLAYLAFYTVHTPIQAARRHLKHYEEKASELPPLREAELREHDGWTKLRQDNAAYASMVAAMDENVGRLLDRLDELGLADQTVVVFTSDNGGLSTLPRRGAPTSNLPLRAGKGWCYEGGIRVPFMIRAPGVGKPGSRSSVPVYSADLYPTMLDLAGLPLAPEQHRDAVSLAPVLKGAPSLDRQFLVWHFPHYHGSAWTPGSAIRAGRWKLIEFYDKEEIELYDLENDQEERNNLAKEMPDKAKELRQRLRSYLSATGAQMPTLNPDHSSSRSTVSEP